MRSEARFLIPPPERGRADRWSATTAVRVGVVRRDELIPTRLARWRVLATLPLAGGVIRGKA
jgi:hypothetical protein